MFKAQILDFARMLGSGLFLQCPVMLQPSALLPDWIMAAFGIHAHS